MKTEQYILPPVDLLKYAIRNRCINQLQVYLFLKTHSIGYLEPTQAYINALCDDLAIKDRRTLQSRLKWLIRENWIGTDGQYYFIRSFKRLYKVLHLQSKIATWLEPEYFKIFKPWLYGSVLGYMSLRKIWKMRSLERKKGRSLPCERTPYFPISKSIIAEELNVSMTEASRIKKIASLNGFIKIHKRFQWISDNEFDRKLYLRGYPEDKGKIIRIRGRLYKQLPDQIEAAIGYRKRGKKSNKKAAKLKSGRMSYQEFKASAKSGHTI